MTVVFCDVYGDLNLLDVMLFDTHTEKGNGTMMSLVVKKVMPYKYTKPNAPPLKKPNETKTVQDNIQ